MTITIRNGRHLLQNEQASPNASKETPLADIIHVGRRFLRSVNLERDFYSPDPLDGYLPTPSALSALDRVSTGIAQPYARAFSVTGSYGSGKSSFALYACKVLAPARFGASAVRQSACRLEPNLGTRLFPKEEAGFWPILVTGSREPVARALTRGLLRGLGRLPNKAGARVLEHLEKKWGEVLSSENPSAQEVTHIFAEASERSRVEDQTCQGLLVVVDEMGKFLEHAARYPAQGDLYVFQEMAEYASRSQQAPLLIITVLHQAFDEYASRLSAMQRQEWQKVQGRFVDIPFGDGPDETLRLVSQAIQVQEDAATPKLRQEWHWQQEECRRLHLMPPAFSAGEFFGITENVYPLHPLTLLLLPHVFRRFGQNERSLFSFLSGDDPHGLSAFLRGHRLTPQHVPWLRPHHLYDYITAAFGSTLYAHPTAKLWSEAEEALSRVQGRDPLQAALVKTVGLLHILGEGTRVPPSHDVLRFALAESGGDTAPVDDALAALQTATLVTYRQFRKAFRLYEGSDIDIDDRLREARAQFVAGADAVALAERLETHPPLVARRHSYETGTLRFFEVRCCRPESLAEEAAAPAAPGGGRLLLCLAPDAAARASAARAAQDITRPDIIVGVTAETDALHEAAAAVECLLWVQAETPEIRNDRVASREVRERLAEATNAFRAEWDRLMRPQALDGTSGGDGAQWFHAGRPVPLLSYRKLQALVSQACDDTYPDTPRLRNELVNRRQISATATSARRSVLEAMVGRRAERRLGIEGFPPEASIYASVLGSTGIHRQAEGGAGYEFGPPPPGGDAGLVAVWAEMERFLFDDPEGDKSLPALNARLAAPPYGVSDGLVPLLLCAVLLCHEDEVIVYEEDRFVTDLDTPTLERMIKRPSDYRLQGYRVSGERRAVVERFARGLRMGETRPTLVNVVRQIYREFNKLPEYTRKTRTLSATAAGLRDMVKAGKQPERLLFDALPRLFGCTPLTAEQADPENAARFFAGWNQAMTAVTGAYDALLARTEAALLEAFGTATGDALRARAAVVLPGATEPRLKSFLLRLADDAPAPRPWLESVAAGVVGRPPNAWADTDAERFAGLLPPLLSAFQNLELIAFDRRQDCAPEAAGLRLAVTRDTGAEAARVVVVPQADAGRVEALSLRLLESFNALLEGEHQDMRVAVLGHMAQEVLRGTHDD